MHMRACAGLGHLPAAALPTPACARRPARPTRPPQAVPRKSASFSVKNQRTPRPSELKIHASAPHADAPRSVDSLPRLRRFSPVRFPARPAVLRVSGRRPGSLGPRSEAQGWGKGGGGVGGASGARRGPAPALRGPEARPRPGLGGPHPARTPRVPARPAAFQTQCAACCS